MDSFENCESIVQFLKVVKVARLVLVMRSSKRERRQLRKCCFVDGFLDS